MPRHDNAVDFWRGFALITIFINHVPGIYFERFTHRNVSLSDSAELFVFLAGWALRLVVDRSKNAPSDGDVVARLGGRTLVIYAAHILIISIAIAMLAAAALLLDNPLLLEWHNAAAAFYDPIRTHIGIVALTHHLGYFDILPLYVVLMAVAPLIALLHRYFPRLLLPVSLTIYLLALSFRISLPSWPVSGTWFFNPLAWQLVFVLGFVLAKDQGLGGFVRRHITWIRWMALPIVIAGALMVQFQWWPDPTKVPEPRLLFVAFKSYLTPLRLIQFLALVAVMSVAYPYIQKLVPRLVPFFSMLGRNSLNVFCVGSILSLASQIARFVYKGTLAIDTLILVTGLLLLGLTAWVSEWRERSTSRG
ncbi:MAG: OpgC domain-containing protein [Hyphomicrobiaceae bacterium]|nr:OpgC domain-containing protein [Hyphomicrobiaceae bacterium]